MSRYILKRLVMLIPVLIGVTFMVYFILSLSPGDTAAIIAGEGADAQTIEAVRKDLGLDKPVIVQYGKYMWNLLHGDMGVSYSTKRPVFTTIMSSFPNTAKLAFWSILVAVAIALPIGIISATRQYSAVDNVGMVAALLGVATPNFWLGLMLIIIFALRLQWLPASMPSIAAASAKYWILPAITIGLPPVASVLRFTRSTMLDVVRQDYIRTARSKGLSEKVVIFKHALRNALLPIITFVGIMLGGTVAGSVVIESIFSIPGIGSLVTTAVSNQDYPIIQGCVLVLSILICLINLVVDVIYGFVDPRIMSMYTSGKKKDHKKRVEAEVQS